MREIKINGSITSTCKTFFHRDLASTYTKKKKKKACASVSCNEFK